MASRVSGNPTVAVEAKMRKVVARASSSPPPRAREEMALMVGMGRVDRVVRVERRVERKWLVLEGGEDGLAFCLFVCSFVCFWSRTCKERERILW